MLSDGVQDKKLEVFSVRECKGSQKAINVYFLKRYQTRYSDEDLVFSNYLHKLVDKTKGLVGKHSGWREGGALQSSGIQSRREVVVAQDNRAELDEGQGGEDDDAEESSCRRARAGRSEGLKRINEKIAVPKGKGSAHQRARGGLSESPKSQGGEDNDAEELVPSPAGASRSTTLKRANQRVADPERKTTPRPRAKANTPVRTSRISPENSSNKELPSSSSAGRTPSVVDEKETGNEDEEDDDSSSGEEDDDSSSGEEEGKAIDEEHKNGEEIAPSIPPTTKYWKAFGEKFKPLEEKEYGSVDDWYRDAQQVIERYKEQLESMSKD